MHGLRLKTNYYRPERLIFSRGTEGPEGKDATRDDNNSSSTSSHCMIVFLPSSLALQSFVWKPCLALVLFGFCDWLEIHYLHLTLNFDLMSFVAEEDSNLITPPLTWIHRWRHRWRESRDDHIKHAEVQPEQPGSNSWRQLQRRKYYDKHLHCRCAGATAP